MKKQGSVEREVASQRRHYRLSVPLVASFNSQEYSTRNWSMGGFSLCDYTGTALPGDEFKVQVLVAFGEFKIKFDTDVRVLRHDAVKREIAVEFFGLKDNQQALLKHFSDSLVLGEMVSIEDTIKRIDLPVTPVSEKPDPLPQAAIPLRRRHLKTMTMSGAYLVFGVVLAYYAIATVYTNIFKMRIDTAAITGPDQVLKAPISGVIDEVYTHIGDDVAVNDPLLFIRNDAMLEEIELARIEIRSAALDLQEKQQNLLSQIETVTSYREFGISKLQIAKAKTIAIKEKLKLAQKQQSRATKLHADGLASAENVDSVAERVIGLKADLEVATAEEKIAERSIEETYNGRFFTDNRLVGEVKELQSAVAVAAERVVIEQDRLHLLESRQQRLNLNASFEGEILSLYANKHQVIEKGEPLLRIEHRTGERGVEALVLAEEMENVIPGQLATIIFGNKREPLDARVTSIERTNLEELGINKRNDDMFGLVRVKLSFAEHIAPEKITALPSGLPVTVEFSTRTFYQYTSALAVVGSFFSSAGIANADEKQGKN